MKKSVILSAAIVAALAGSALAQSVEFRIMQRPAGGAGQATGDVSSTENIKNFAVQARVVGGSASQGLGNFSFNIVMDGEAESNGTLTRIRTSNADGTYNNNTANNPNQTVGQGGLAGQYSYLAGLSAAFNGVLNANSGAWTQTAFQDIGLVTGAPIGTGLLAVTDVDGDGAPDTGTNAVDSTIANTYFGAGGNWVDLYRFRYTVTNFAGRTVNVGLTGLSAQVFTNLQESGGNWGPDAPTSITAVSGTGTSFNVIPAPASAALLGLGGLVAARRRRSN